MRNGPDSTIYKIDIDSLTVGYNDVPLISDISLSVNPGEIVSLIGPNGSGKSTILKTITRQLAAIAGTVYIDGRNMRLMSGKDLAVKLAVVLTERIRPELMTCFEFVAAGRYPYTGNFGILTEEDKEIVWRSLDMVHLRDLSDRYISKISDGQFQRMLIARAICQEPEIIVLDEPTSFLDIKHKIELLEILSGMAKDRNITVIMSLHEIDLAEKVSDRIVCVKGDHIAACGTPEEIFDRITISSLYDISSGSFDPVLGSTELAAPKGDTRCFVIGGNGTGIPFYRELQKKGIPFAAGILMPNDIDVSVAGRLANEVVCSDLFAPASDEQIERAKQIIDGSEFVVVCGCPAGEYNTANTALEEYAAGKGKKIIRSLADLREES